MTPKVFKAIILALTVSASGCGTEIISFAPLSTAPALPTEGNYKGVIPGAGSVLIDTDAYGDLLIAVTDSVIGTGTLTGSTTVTSGDTFSTALANSSQGVLGVSGSTFSNNIRMNVNGNTVVLTSIGSGNPFLGSYSGTMTGGSLGSSAPVSFMVAETPLPNVSGTVTAQVGAMAVSGTINAVGTFTGTASGAETLNLSGNLAFPASGSAQGSGTWVNAGNATDTGTWSVTESATAQLRRK